jgi:hypothetical protein
MAEPIRNGDGEKKQDCEHEAGKRRLCAHGEECRWLKPTLSGDDLYPDQPFCELVWQGGMSFIFTCKPDSHPRLSETVENSCLEEKEVGKWTGRRRQVCVCRWINGVPLRDSSDALLVNYLYFQIRGEQTGKPVYTNSRVTDKKTGTGNAGRLAACGRKRWKIENEHNNVSWNFFEVRIFKIWKKITPESQFLLGRISSFYDEVEKTPTS